MRLYPSVDNPNGLLEDCLKAALIGVSRAKRNCFTVAGGTSKAMSDKPDTTIWRRLSTGICTPFSKRCIKALATVLLPEAGVPMIKKIGFIFVPSWCFTRVYALNSVRITWMFRVPTFRIECGGIGAAGTAVLGTGVLVMREESIITLRCSS